ncbi:MAG: hypothetical protein M3Z21_08625 [Pseudomonadota bacterium]|nr:hypothetical protein [Pseudomonadota bacterium]
MAISDHYQGTAGRSDFAPVYWKQVRIEVFTLLRMGYERLPASAFRDAEEPDITGELARVMNDITEDHNSPEWAWRYQVHDDPPVNLAGRFGKHRPRLDLRVDRTSRGPRPRYLFEAKRLNDGNQSAKKYLGKDGLGMFIAGTYGREVHEAGMLGYVQSGDIDQWVKKIADQLEVDPRTTAPEGIWTAVPVVENLASYRSQHPRTTLAEPITIFHIFINFQ